MHFMMKKQVCVLIVIFLLNLESIKSSQDESCLVEDAKQACYSENPYPYRYYGTKTAYKEVRDNSTDGSDLELGNCTAKVFYLLSRHATRYPDKEEISEMIKFLPVLKEKIINASLHGKAHLCAEDLEKLKEWTFTLVPENGKKLSETGEAEAEELAQRFKERFSSILKQNYSPEKFVFEYTNKERTRSTAEAFAKGLFNDQYNLIDFDNKTNDDVLTFHKACKKFQKECNDPSYDLSEVEKVKNGDLMKAMVARVSNKIGLSLTGDQIEIIYKACAFGHALETDDVWCSLFSTADLKVLEFAGDIDDYYKDAYGNKINYEQACPVAKYILDLFNSSENSSDTKVVMHFSHAGAIKKVYPMFGLFEDPIPLTADAFCSQRDRKWRSSFVVPFNANIALVLYECGKEYKVATFHNERLVHIKGCTDKLCSFKEFYEEYSLPATHCNINKICCTCCNY